MSFDLGDDERGVTLTKDGRDLLDSHLVERGDEPSQSFYAGVSWSREIDHDANLYATYGQEEAEKQFMSAGSENGPYVERGGR